MSTVEPPCEDRPEWREADTWIAPSGLTPPDSTRLADAGEFTRLDLPPVPTPTLRPGDRVAVHCGDDTYTLTVPRSDQEPDMTTQTRHAELVALLNKISEESVTASNVLADMLDLLRERLPGRAEVKVAPFDPDLIARNLDAIKHELETPVGEHGECCDPGEVTEDQPIVTRIVDRDGDVWERREEGWSLWHSSEWGPWRGHGRWPQPPGNGILRPATPADLARVGIEDERGGWQAKHAALRADVERERGNLARAGGTFAVRRLDRVLHRDDDRTPQAD